MNEWTVALKGTYEPNIYNEEPVPYLDSVLHHIHNDYPIFAAYVKEKDQWICHYCYEAAPENYGFLAELLDCKPRFVSMDNVNSWHNNNKHFWKKWFPNESW